MALKGEFTKRTLKQDPGDSNLQFTKFINTIESFTRELCEREVSAGSDWPHGFMIQKKRRWVLGTEKTEWQHSGITVVF